jgi:hypothetical protein
MLNEFKYKSSKLWKHLNDLIGASKSKSIPIEPNKLNEFFTSVFRQAPPYDPADTAPLPNETFNNHSMHFQAYLTLMLLDLMAFFLKLLNKMLFIYQFS